MLQWLAGGHALHLLVGKLRCRRLSISLSIQQVLSGDSTCLGTHHHTSASQGKASSSPRSVGALSLRAHAPLDLRALM